MAIESKLGRGPVGRPLGLSEDKKKGTVLIWIGIVLALAVAFTLWWFLFRPMDSLKTTESIAAGDYQAVFLDSGQVYFGRLQMGKEDFFTLTDVFYLQSGSAVGLDQLSNLSLVKLGNEAHGPQDVMKINKAHVLFIEDMKADSKVVQAIQDYKNKNFKK